MGELTESTPELVGYRLHVNGQDYEVLDAEIAESLLHVFASGSECTARRTHASRGSAAHARSSSTVCSSARAR